MLTNPALAADSPLRLESVPAKITFSGPRQETQLVITGHYETGRIADLTHTAASKSSNESVVRVSSGLAHPTGNGQAEISISSGMQTIKVPVEVTNFERVEPVSFQYGALAALSKQGCSAGACHGSPTGKGGFRLSLRGFDAQLDELTLVRESFGRRTNALEPERSLLLQKPTMKVPHEGGLKLTKTDPAYALLRDWIAAGCRPDAQDAAVCEKIEVFPSERILAHPNFSQQLRVVAHFSDGTLRDITRLAVYSSSEEQVATVDANGRVTAKERGDAAVMVRYLDHLDVANLTFLRDVPGFAWPDAPESNDIDRLVHQKLRQLQIPPSPVCTDGEFIRRLYLDVLGILPTKDETLAFLADSSPAKRKQLIDRVLARPEYAEQAALLWADLLRVKGSKVGAPGVHKYHRWLVAAMRDNLPYDQFVRALLTASGSTFTTPQAAYFSASADVNDTAETTAQIFLGARIQCARCHNHPYDRWSQDNYYGLGAFFSRVQRKATAVPGESIVWLAPSGEVTQPRTLRIAKPWLPEFDNGAVGNALRGVPNADGTRSVPATLVSHDRREIFANWLTSRENRLFAQVGANRIWGRLLGRGIVEPVDDFRPSNPPSNPSLLDKLSADFAASGFNQKELVRQILNTRAYQASSAAVELNQRDEKYFSHAKARLLSAEQLLDAISQVTGVAEKFGGLPAGTRAGQLPSPDVPSSFLKTFGQPGRESACACERSGDPKLAHALQLINGPLISQKLRAPGSRLAYVPTDKTARLKAAGKPPADKLALWLRADAGALDTNGTPAADGDAVANWQDQSGANRHATQGNVVQRPLFVSDGINGLPALRFDGRDDFLNNTTDNLVAPGAPRTVLAVARAAEPSRGGVLMGFRRTTSVFAVQHITIDSTYYVYSDGLNAAGNTTIPFDRVKETRRPFISAFLSGGAGQKLAVCVSGEPQPLTQPGAIGPDNGAAGFTIGSREDIAQGSQGWTGEISEVLVYDKLLSPEEHAAAGAYLATKYDLATRYVAIPRRPTDSPAEAKAEREFIADFYLSALSRAPTAGELAAALAYLAESPDRHQGLEDLAWALLNSREFLFQH